MKFNAVIFDLYGTLVNDFASSVGQLHADFVSTLGVPPDSFMKLWRETTEMRVIGAFQTVEASIEYVCNQLGVPITMEQLSRAVEIRLQLIRRTLSPRPDALATLARLKNDDYRIGLLDRDPDSLARDGILGISRLRHFLQPGASQETRPSHLSARL
jgi:putative hydrolase of the HAD superfamily